MPTSGGGGAAAVGTGNITDDTILNEDINSAAAIDATKLALDNTIDNTDIQDDLLVTATISVSSADILAIHTTGKVLVAAPGAGKIVFVERVLYSFTAGTQYQLGDAVRVQYVGDTVAIIAAGLQAELQGASNFVNARNAALAVVATAGINAAVELKAISATAFTTGTGTLKVFIKYRVVTL